MSKHKTLFVLVLSLLLVSTVLLLCWKYIGKSDKTSQDVLKDGITRLSSYEELERLITEKAGNSNALYRYGASKGGMEAATDSSAADGAAQGAGAGGQGATDYSDTNVQVEGVDEADIIKTDGEYIYQVSKNRVVITRAYPASKMEIISSIGFSDKSFQASEIYIDSGKLVVIGSTLNVWIMTGEDGIPEDRVSESDVAPDAVMTADIAGPGYYYGGDSVKVLIYNIIDIGSPALLREVTIDGYYISSRKIGPFLYVVTNKNAYRYFNNGLEPVIPVYRDTASGDTEMQLDYSDMYYFLDSNAESYMLVSAMALDDLEGSMKISAYLGAGSNIYCSAGNLYVAVYNYREYAQNQVKATDGSVPVTDVSPVSYEMNTLVFKFKLDKTEVGFIARGEVPGTIINQFSMDEYVEYFRIATTKGSAWGDGQNLSKNNVYVLDENMLLTGKIEDIAPGENIYSTRFMGIRVYMVTFRITDPLFVIDLSEPANPKILGALKIPGYSDYLHPYDENHIIGFGKDTAEVSSFDSKGGAPEVMAFYQGIKMALFDVSDVSNPVQMYSEIIGDRGTDSELLRNHKALLFSKEKGLIAFPVTLYEIDDNNVQGNSLYEATQYGQFTFQGAYVYGFDLNEGFKLKGRITHMSADDYLKAGDYYYEDKSLRRIIFIDDTLYTISNSIIRANLINGLEQTGQLVIP